MNVPTIKNTGDAGMSKGFLPFFIALCFCVDAAAQGLDIRRVVPNGREVGTDVDKIVFEFDRPVVNLGATERTADEVPVKIKPAVECGWRWLNRETLACQLEKGGLKPASVYKISVDGGFKTATGETLGKTRRFSFETKRPELNLPATRFVDFAAPERPRWQAAFTVPVKDKSVRSNLYFKSDGKKIKADVAPVKCFDWENDCDLRRLITPVRDLGVDTPYELVFDDGFKAEDGGDLKSEKSGVAGTGRTLPVFQTLALRCYDEKYNLQSFSAEQSRLKTPECRFDASVDIVLSDKTVLGNASEFVKVTPAAAVADREYVSNTISLFPQEAGQTYAVSVSESLTDVWGNKIAAPATFYFKAGDRRPNLNLPYSAVVLEQNEATAAYGYAVNLNGAAVDYAGFDANGSVSGRYDVPEINPLIRNIAYPFDYGVRAMLRGKSGFVAGKFNTTPAVGGTELFAASVSPWQIVAKIGWKSSLVWAVDFKTGKPVSGAKVELFAAPLDNPSRKTVSANAKTDRTGRAELAGYDAFDPAAEKLNQWNNAKPSLFVSVAKGEQVAVLPLQSQFSLSAGALSDWNVSSVYFPEPQTYRRAFGFTPQGVYRPGDEVGYKIYVREVDGQNLGKAPATGYDLTVSDSAGAIVFKRKGVSLSAFGAMEGTFALPANAVSGWYDVTLKRGAATLYPMRFLVSDFTPAAFKSATEVNGKLFKAKSKVAVRSRAELFSGGPFAGADMRQTAVLNYVPFGFGDGENAFSFDPEMAEKDYAPETLFDARGVADNRGELLETRILPRSEKPYGKIRFETKVYDDSGRSYSSFATAEYFSTDRLVGLRQGKGEPKAGSPASVEYVVVNPARKKVAGVPVKIVFTRRQNKLIREKSAGSAYLSKYVSVDEQVGECMGMSATIPQTCVFTPDKSGLYKATASVDGGVASRLSFYVQGADFVPWTGAENRLKIVPDKKEYAVGDTISLTVENPAAGAIALVTVERYGVAESFVRTLDKSLEKIEIPVKAGYFPGVYVSVAAFSPRVDRPVKGDVDLGKPAQWTGYLKIPVVDPDMKIKIDVSPEREEYRPSDVMKVRLSAKLPDQKQPVEAAVVVLDESVLSLLPDGEKAFDPYAGLNKLGDLDVRTYSLVEQLIGRQKIEKKGANQGGDGGSDFAVRDVFKYVAYFNPSLKLDKNGEGSFEMKLPDNLTGWRVIAAAVTPERFAGMAQARVTVSLPLEVRALTPNNVRSGDDFSAGASVLNRTSGTVDAVVSMRASGAVEKDVVSTRRVALAPYERKAVFFDFVTAKLNPSDGKGEIALTFKAEGGAGADALRLKLPVLAMTETRTAAEYGSSNGEGAEIPVAVPDAVKSYGGRLSVSVSAGVLNGLAPTVRAMRDYPHPCWEQKLSRALAAAVYVKNKTAVSSEELWADADAFVRDVLKQASAYQAENGGMAYFVADNARVSPYLTAYTAFAFDFLTRAGYAVNVNVQAKLADYLTGFFKRTDRAFDPAEMLTARLLSADYLKKRGLVSDADIAVFDESLPQMTAFDKALYLRLRLTDALVDDLVNASFQTSGTMVFKDAPNAATLASSAKSTCAAINAFDDEKTAERLMRGAYSLRGANGTWTNTQANAFCLTALSDYAEKTKTDVDLSLEAEFDGDDVLSADFKSTADPSVSGDAVLKAENAGKTAKLEISADGKGRYYYQTVLSYPSDPSRGVNAGLRVERRYFVENGGGFVPFDDATVLKRGDRVKVELTVTTPVSLPMVALRDPVAGAFEPIDSSLATAGTAEQDNGAFYFKDTGRAAVGFYADELPAGTHTVSYAAQVVSGGVFTAFPAKVEAMYTPDVFGLTAADRVKVAE